MEVRIVKDLGVVEEAKEVKDVKEEARATPGPGPRDARGPNEVGAGRRGRRRAHRKVEE